MKRKLCVALGVSSMLIYTVVNRTSDIVVGRFGCGCVPSFNSNSFSSCVYIVAAGIMVLFYSESMREQKEDDRMKKLLNSVILGLFGFFFFYVLNYHK